MNILHSLWNIVSTEDEMLMKYVLLFLSLIEIYVTMKFFTTILDITYTKKQRNSYIIIMFFVGILSTFVIPKELCLFINLIVLFYRNSRSYI